MPKDNVKTRKLLDLVQDETGYTIGDCEKVIDYLLLKKMGTKYFWRLPQNFKYGFIPISDLSLEIGCVLFFFEKILKSFSNFFKTVQSVLRVF